METRCGGKSATLRHHYTEASRDKALAIAGSCEFLELTINGSDFARQRGIEIGSPVKVRW